MTYNEILSDLGKKIYRPIYLLHGEEPYYIDKISNLIENGVLPEADAEFNLHVVYGKDVTVQEIDSMAKQYPFAADYQVVIVKEAQNVRGLAELKEYAKNPLKTTILVLCYKYGKFDGRTEFFKTVSKTCCEFHSEKEKDYNLPRWIESYLRSLNLTAENRVPEMLAEHIGNDLQRIENEIKKLQQAVPGISRITVDHIEENIGISKVYNLFELQDAFATKNRHKVFFILKGFEKNPKENPPQKIIPMLFTYFKNLFLLCYVKDDAAAARDLKMNPYVVKNSRRALQFYTPMKLFNIISLFREYDMKTKGVDAGNADPNELMRELAIKILA